MSIDTSVFKAYDIRGIYPSQINEDLVYKIGQAYAQIIKPQGKVAVGMDVRLSSPQLKKALIEGLTDAGVSVVDVGLISTEMIYFATGFYKLAGGICVTASHNPAEYNGMKMVREEAKPISSDTGIFEIRDWVAGNNEIIETDIKGEVETQDILADFVKFALGFVDITKIKPLKLVYNPNFGYEGEVLKKAVEIGNLPLELVGINENPDGHFPKGRPDPFVPENRPEFMELVKSSKADLGVTWDADADRVFFCAGSGTFVEPYHMNALLIKGILKKYPASTIIYDPRYTWAVIDSTIENGGKVDASRVGHSFIKEKMRKVDAVFSGEASGHTYFRDFYFADSGLIPLLIVLEMVSTEGDLDTLLKPYWDKYFISGEINTKTEKAQEIMTEIEAKYADGEISKLDGLSVEYTDWRASVRTSNTEPLLRLNVEAKSQEKMEEMRDELLKMIQN